MPFQPLVAGPVRACATAALLALGALPAHALELEYSGFASLVGGRSFGNCEPNNTIGSRFSGACTRFITDWSHAGVYTPSFSFKPESRLGLQATARINNQLSATTQLVARALSGNQGNLEWAYLTWEPTPEWTLQAGRMRLPLFYFSDFQDVGYAYTWLRPPPDVYGWDVVNFNGGKATWRQQVLGWSLKASAFGGSENSKDNAYSTLMYSGQPKSVEWRAIRGAALELSRGVFTGRIVGLANGYAQLDQASDAYDLLLSGRDAGKQRIWGLSANIDADPWLVRSEYSVFDRSDFQYKAKAYMLSAGYRIDKLTPMLTVSGYAETTPFPSAYNTLKMRSQAATLRYEVGDSSAVKLQFDRYVDRSPAGPFSGTANAVAVGFDTVF